MYQAKPPPNYLRTRQTNQNNQERRPRFETEAAKPKGQPTESETQPTNTKGRCAGELCVHKGARMPGMILGGKTCSTCSKT